jgi:hypothetical protein
MAPATQTPTPDSADRPGPGSSAAGRWEILAANAYQALLALTLFYVLLKVWPHPTPSGKRDDGGSSARAQAPAGDSARRDSVRRDSVRRDSVRLGLSTAAPSGGDSARGDSARAGVGSGAGSGTASDPAPGVGGYPGHLWCDSALQKSWSPADSLKDPECVSVFGRQFPIWKGQRMLLFVMIAGALGALFRGLSSLVTYVGQRRLLRSWLPLYYVQPIRGAILGLFFYLLFRGGLFSPNASFDDTDPVGFMAVAALVGIFEKEATKKLQQIASAVFAPHDEKTDAADADSASDKSGKPGKPDRPGAGGGASGTSAGGEAARSTVPVFSKLDTTTVPAASPVTTASGGS